MATGGSKQTNLFLARAMPRSSSHHRHRFSTLAPLNLIYLFASLEGYHGTSNRVFHRSHDARQRLFESASVPTSTFSKRDPNSSGQSVPEMIINSMLAFPKEGGWAYRVFARSSVPLQSMSPFCILFTFSCRTFSPPIQ